MSYKHISELKIEDIVVIYPGRFQPFHKGHNDVYRLLKDVFPNVFITTTNTKPKSKKDISRYPFDFEDKKKIMIKLGNVDPLDIVPSPTRFPYSDSEVLSYIKSMKKHPDREIKSKFDNIDLNNCVCVFIVSDKDIDRFKFPESGLSYTKKQTPAKIQKLRLVPLEDRKHTIPHFNNINLTQIYDTFNYILFMPTFDFNVFDTDVRSATELRKMIVEPPEGKTSVDVVKELYKISEDDSREEINEIILDIISKINLSIEPQ